MLTSSVLDGTIFSFRSPSWLLNVMEQRKKTIIWARNNCPWIRGGIREVETSSEPSSWLVEVVSPSFTSAFLAWRNSWSTKTNHLHKKYITKPDTKNCQAKTFPFFRNSLGSWYRSRWIMLNGQKKKVMRKATILITSNPSVEHKRILALLNNGGIVEGKGATKYGPDRR